MTAPSTILAILYATPQASHAESESTAEGAPRFEAPFETTLEQALAAIEREPRGYVEPDGSFTLHASSKSEAPSSLRYPSESESPRIDGEIYDFDVPGVGGRIHHVDVRGTASSDLWQTIFDALSPRGAKGVVVFLPDAGETLSGEAFLVRLTAK